MRAVAAACLLLSFCISSATAWLSCPGFSQHSAQLRVLRGNVRVLPKSSANIRNPHAVCMVHMAGEWVKLGGGKDGDAVQKLVLEPGSGKLAEKGAEVEVQYVGKIADKDWSVEDVLECWLSAQTFRPPFGVVPKEGQYYAEQGMIMYAEAFTKNGVDGNKLLSPDIFTEDFISKTLGVDNKMHCKKLANAARKLRENDERQPCGSEFDAGVITFTLGQGKVIKGWEMAVATMHQGETAQVKMRSDYAYGKDGFRRRSGEVVVSPYATLKFNLKLLQC